jgi:hypothetical protein
MKKIILTCLITFISHHSFSQKIISTDKIIYKVPKRTVDLSNAQLSKLKQISSNGDIIRDKKPNKNLIQIDNVLISTRVANFVNKPDHLETLRTSFSYDSTIAPSIKFKIGEVKKLKTSEYLIVEYEYKTDSKTYVLFYADNHAHTKALSGAAEFPQNERHKSLEIIQTFITNLKFKSGNQPGNRDHPYYK